MEDARILVMKSGAWVACLLAILISAGGLPCKAEDSEEHSDHEEAAPVEGGVGENHEDEPGGTIQLSKEEMAEFGITFEQVGPADIETVIELPGEVHPNQDRLAHLVPRFAGIVTEVYKRVGDSVKQGDVLALIESSETLSKYKLKSLIDGIVIARHITRGESVSPETEAFVVADLQTVWVDLSVYQTDLDQVRVGQKVIVMAGQGRSTAEATISYLAPVVDEQTRTAVARIVIPNPDGIWRPGMFVTGAVTVETAEAAVVVPRTAVQTLGGESVVFVLDPDGIEPREVTLGRSNRERVEVLNGLVAGDRFAVSGSFILKSELEKAGFEAGHGH
jgi:cobalt-zinc-cadmium efflux system membrane fusion protein